MSGRRREATNSRPVFSIAPAQDPAAGRCRASRAAQRHGRRPRRSSEPPARVSGERATRLSWCLGVTTAIQPRTRQRAEACRSRKPSNDRFLPTASELARVTRAGWERKRRHVSERGRASGSPRTLLAYRPSPGWISKWRGARCLQGRMIYPAWPLRAGQGVRSRNRDALSMWATLPR